MKRLLAIIAAALLLTACGGDEHKGEHCVASHVESGIMPIISTVSCGTNCFTTITTYVPYEDTVCDQWAPDDPATVKPS